MYIIKGRDIILNHSDFLGLSLFELLFIAISALVDRYFFN